MVIDAINRIGCYMNYIHCILTIHPINTDELFVSSYTNYALEVSTHRIYMNHDQQFWICGLSSAPDFEACDSTLSHSAG